MKDLKTNALTELADVWDEVTEYLRLITPYRKYRGDQSVQLYEVETSKDLTLEKAEQPYTADDLLQAFNRYAREATIYGDDRTIVARIKDATRQIVPTRKQIARSANAEELMRLRVIYLAIYEAFSNSFISLQPLDL